MLENCDTIKKKDMADITMCLDKECSRKLDCYRFTAPVSEILQSYFMDSPRKGNHCDMYWEAKKSATKRTNDK